MAGEGNRQKHTNMADRGSVLHPNSMEKCDLEKKHEAFCCRFGGFLGSERIEMPEVWGKIRCTCGFNSLCSGVDRLTTKKRQFMSVLHSWKPLVFSFG